MIIKTTDVPRIQFLVSMPYNSIGEVVKVCMETKNEVYYYDGGGRYCYLDKNEEGTIYRYIPMGQRLNAKRNKYNG